MIVLIVSTSSSSGSGTAMVTVKISGAVLAYGGIEAEAGISIEAETIGALHDERQAARIDAQVPLDPLVPRIR